MNYLLTLNFLGYLCVITNNYISIIQIHHVAVSSHVSYFSSEITIDWIKSKVKFW